MLTAESVWVTLTKVMESGQQKAPSMRGLSGRRAGNSSEMITGFYKFPDSPADWGSDSGGPTHKGGLQENLPPGG